MKVHMCLYKASEGAINMTDLQDMLCRKRMSARVKVVTLSVGYVCVHMKDSMCS